MDSKVYRKVLNSVVVLVFFHIAMILCSPVQDEFRLLSIACNKRIVYIPSGTRRRPNFLTLSYLFFLLLTLFPMTKI